MSKLNHPIAGVPLIVAINKVDKPGADIERVKQVRAYRATRDVCNLKYYTCNSPPSLPFQELLELNLVAEEWGGTTTIVPVSAKKGTGVADLLQVWRRGGGRW